MNTASSTSPQINNLSFSGHQTFPFRYTWLKKGVDAVENPTIFSSENASVTLGVGKNMVASIRHWCKVAGLIRTDPNERGQFVATKLGKAIFDNGNGFDPYLDDPATLWLIHSKIVTNTDPTTLWYWAFNVFRENQFTPDIFKKQWSAWAQQKKPSMRPASPKTLQRDIRCFIRTYCQSRQTPTVVEESSDCPLVELNTYCQSRQTPTVVEESFDCPLVELNLITKLPENNRYEFQRGEKETLYEFQRGEKETLPVEIFASTLVELLGDKFH